MNRRFVLGSIAAAAALVLATGVTPAMAASGPDMQVTASAPGGVHVIGDELPVTLTVTNIGDYPISGVRGDFHRDAGTDLQIFSFQWGDLDPYGPGLTFQPGESRTFTVTGTITTWAGPIAGRIGVSDIYDTDPSNNLAPLTAPVVDPAVTEDVAGQVFGDADWDGVPSPGEGLAGVNVRLSDYHGGQNRAAVTDSTGHFSIPAVPAGRYHLDESDAPGGWIVPLGSQDVRVDGTGSSGAFQIKAERPLSETLHVKMKLDKRSYAAGETAVLTVTLANSGKRTITGIFGACDRVGDERDLLISQAGWGELYYAGPGATVKPGQTRTIKVTGTIRDKTRNIGYLRQDCDFSQGDTYLMGAPQASATAKVTGLDGVSPGVFFHDDNGNHSADPGEGLPAQQLLLTDLDNGHVLRAKTDATGNVQFTGPAGRYRITVLGPWKLAPDNDIATLVAPPLQALGWTFEVTHR